MKRLILILLVVSVAAGFEPKRLVSAQGIISTRSESDSGGVVCPPGIYTQDPLDCLPLGPSSTLTQSSVYGTYPPTPRADYNPDYALNYVPFNYFRVNKAGTSSYLSLSDAEAKSGALSSIGPGMVYVTYASRTDTGSGVYYYLSNGTWIPGDGSRVTPGIFQGKAFSTTPRTGFGWVLAEATSRQRPDFNNSGNPPVRTYYRFNFVPVYASKVFNGTEWLMIGDQEWVEGRFIASVFPSTTPPSGVNNGRWIDINLAEQTLSAYDNDQLVFSTIISSGVDPYWTRPGLFQIYQKKDTENMSGAFAADRSDFYSLQDVPWTMYFDKARAIHGAYWHTFFGYTMSHGCVNMSIGDAAWLYQWAKEGDWVWVHDPSGRTPVDPDLYGNGAP
jgi:L,D-transpeptidase catalytic domain